MFMEHIKKAILKEIALALVVYNNNVSYYYVQIYYTFIFRVTIIIQFLSLDIFIATITILHRHIKKQLRASLSS